MSSLRVLLHQAIEQHRSGNLNQAEQGYRQVLQVDPHEADALHLLGMIAHQLGRNEVAVQYITQAIGLRPAQAEFKQTLGSAYQALGNLDGAAALYRQALDLRPDFPEALNNLGNAVRAQGKPDEAVTYFQRALRLRPDFAEAHNNLGNALQERGATDEAIGHYAAALRLRPDYAEAHYNLGNARLKQRQLEQAAAHFQEAIRLRPHYVEAHNNLGNALQAQRKLAEAATHFQRALDLRPDFAEAQHNLGNALRYQGAADQAIGHYLAALRLRPDFAEAHNSLGNTRQDQGHLAEALVHYREALRLKPDDARFHSNLLFCMSHEPNIRPEELFAEHCRWGDVHGTVRAPIPPPTSDPAPERRLRIGYVSADFRDHAVARFVEPILTHHDRCAVEVFCYDALGMPDGVTRRLQRLGHEWRPIRDLDDIQTAAQVRADSIDILVDLTGHTANHRLCVFAHKPAPVQVAYLGYPGTTGLRAIDYRLTDAVLEPWGEPIWSTEALVRLDRGKYCFAPPADAADVAAPPVQRTGRITFGSFHRLCKLNAGVLDVWCRILQAVPGARLLMLRETLAGSAREELLKQFRQRGVCDQQFEVRDAAKANEYRRLFADVDISLDTFPYNAVTLSCESLWMGVPFTTLRGDRPAGRAGASLLTHVGLADLIADTPEQLVERTLALASDQQRLADLRGELRQRLRHTLCDGAAFTRTLEAAYRDMWHTYAEAHRCKSQQR